MGVDRNVDLEKWYNTVLYTYTSFGRISNHANVFKTRHRSILKSRRLNNFLLTLNFFVIHLKLEYF